MQVIDENTYTAYDPETGEIICTFSGDPMLKELWVNHVEGKYDGDDYYIVDGAAVLKPEETRGLMKKQKEEGYMRSIRNGLLSDTDWIMGQDSRYTGDKLEEWKVYRQALRDLPENIDDIFNVNWPQKPE